jgi:hypothetical protein
MRWQENVEQTQLTEKKIVSVASLRSVSPT